MYGYKIKPGGHPAQEDNILSFRRGDKSPAGGWQVFDLKMLADMEHAYRIRLKDHLRTYRQWQKRQCVQNDLTVRLYGSAEGRMLRRQVEEALRFYWMIRHDFRCAFRTYMEELEAKRWRPSHTDNGSGCF